MKMIDDHIAQSIYQQFQDADRVLLVTHERPDGDAIGSLLGLGLALRNANKSIEMICPDGVPVNMRFLDGSEHIQKSPKGYFDFIIVLDCSDINRTADVLDDFKKIDLNIDHHKTNDNFARINIVINTAVSTSEIVYQLIKKTDLFFTREITNALIMGLITDTLGFRTPNVTPRALRVGAELMELGADLHEIYYKSLVSRSVQSARFWGKGLEKLVMDDRIVWTTLMIADRKAVNYSGKDDADLINILSSIEGAVISIIFVEQPAGKVKISWRAQPGYDITKVAMKFGGGGHAAAAGAEVYGEMQEITRIVLDETRELLGSFKKEEILTT
jgi:phosphoesterase RecJ-like protein